MAAKCPGRHCTLHQLSLRNIMKKNFLHLLVTLVVTMIVLRTLFLSETKQAQTENTPAEKVVVRHVLPVSTDYPFEKCVENNSAQNFTDFNGQPQNMKDFLTYRHCKSFPLIRDSPMKCADGNGSKDVFLFLAIKTAPANYDRREAIRKTWGEEKSYLGANVKRIFLSGVSRNKKESKRMLQLLEAESHTYGDILQWDFEDTFYNLTLKQVLFHKWMDLRCPGTQFIFNGDDDVFVNPLNVITYLRGLEFDGLKKHLFVGALNIGMPPVREKYSKYYVPEELFPGDSFAPYCGGGGILMSGFTAHAISRKSTHIPLFPIDDAYLGMCLKKAGLRPHNHEGMRTFGIKMPNEVDSFDLCYYRDMLMVHRFIPYEMLIMWKSLKFAKPNCKTQIVNISKP
ncbi:acetylgalactosaminyl-O-glycosyl-glycoprotein beta-1,3-N-acetylglucosaminyltransferase-like isoform X1 [Rana temporaria]|uniref:acetylgalactosaminyl-O-glycosyl-glycoprotein beta-1,3-N-acetylglucosaminyltransferase-like isoform X1 n=1 Tax=Rana temporaria TaxID=8407 RepID=UPI001AAD8AAE|nr:acetylgalactosaminyl-O-glycosyl-glycoprotein beta-1,3-N-acetylglucosaminyltransferase-like isoform X1 [Rana temporaria]